MSRNINNSAIIKIADFILETKASFKGLQSSEHKFVKEESILHGFKKS